MSQNKAMIDKLLTEVSNMYNPLENDFVCENALPSLAVKQDSGFLGGYGFTHLISVNSQITGEGEYRRIRSITRKPEDNQYFITKHGLYDVVTEDDYNNVEEPYEAESETTLGVTSNLMVEKELVFRNGVLDAGVVTQGQTLAGTSQFSDYVNSKPLEVFKDARGTVLDGCGKQPNKAIISQKLEITLQYHPDILDTLGYSENRAGRLTRDEIAHAMGVDKIYVGSASQSLNGDDLEQIWGGDVLFYHAPDKAAKKQVSFGYYLFSKSGKRRVMVKDAQNPPTANNVFVDDKYQFLITNPKAAYAVRGAI